MAKRTWVCTCTDPLKNLICAVCAAAMTGYAPKTVLNKAEAGELPSVPLSRRHRMFLRESLLYWIKSRETGVMV